MQQSSNKTKLVIGILVAVVGFFIVRSMMNARPVVNGETPDPAYGAENPLVTIREYSDLQCPACRAAQRPLHDFVEKHKDVVRLEFNDFPLVIHRNAKPAAYAANCAIEQGKFWEYVDLVFDKQPEWESLGNPLPKFVEYFASLGGDADKFESCAKDRTYQHSVDEDIKEALDANINSTPTFFVNGERLVGGQDAATWEAILAPYLSSGGPRK